MTDERRKVVRLDELDDCDIELDDGQRIRLSVGYAHGGEVRIHISGETLADVHPEPADLMPLYEEK
jgi:hypothetical protein